MEMLVSAAQWIAPAATMIAAMMTAANLGARVTGWGFIVFTLGSLCWAAIGISTGQTNLLATNAFLTLVNLVGIWRWLGRQAKYQDGAKTAAAQSQQGNTPSVIAASSLGGLPVKDAAGEAIGECVEALVDCRTGQIGYVVVATRNAVGLDEQLRGVARATCHIGADAIELTIDADKFSQLPVLADRNWPARL